VSVTQQQLGWRAIALAVIVAISFAANSAFAALAYAGGSNALSVLTLRSTASFLILYLFLAGNRIPRGLPISQRVPALALGLVMVASSYGLLGAIEFMPVALVVITVYTYPILVACAGWLSGRELFRPRFAIALVIAFLGLIFALNLNGTQSNTRGIGLASIAALGVAVLLLANERIHGGHDSRPFTLHMQGTAMAVFCVASVLSGQFSLPYTFSGWVGLVCAPLCYAFASVFLFVVLSRLGSIRTALIMNFEPVASVVFGYLLLAQTLGNLQLFGIALVVGAVVAIEAGKSTA